MWTPAIPAHDDAIVEMCRALYREDPGTHDVTDPQIRRTLETLRAEPARGRALVLDADGQPRGYALLISFWSNELGGELCTIDELYVAPEHRNRGHATRLIRALAAGPAVALELEVSPDNARARAFYQREGFRPIRNTMLRRLP